MVTQTGALGKVYEDGDIIMCQGDQGDCMFVIQEGSVDILVEREGRQVLIANRGEGDIIGEMAIFEDEVRMATVKAKGHVRILTVDKRNFLRRIHQDPSIAYSIVQAMSHRIRQLTQELAQLKSPQ
jgi:CRP-like cAMP-binding protein